MQNNEYILKHFKFYHEGKANDEAVICGEKYRFTILTDRLFRIEYQDEGKFENRPSQVFWYRNQTVPKFKVKETKETLEIITSYWHIVYQKEVPFSESALVIKKVNDKGGNHNWHYGMNNKGNLKGTYRTLDRINGGLKLEDGLISSKGFVVVDDSKSYVFNDNGWIEEQNKDLIDIYFFGYGKDFKSCIKDYYKISGKTPLLPRFALGNWWSRYWNYTDEELKDLINQFMKRDIPLSVCIIDMDWHLTELSEAYGDGWTGYTWNEASFPNPSKFIAWLKENKLKTSLNLHPALGFRGHESCYEAIGKFMNVNVEEEEPVTFDCTDPKFMNAYFTKAHHPLEEMGVDFWWMDWQQGTTSKIQGLDPLFMLNHLHYLDLKRDSNKRGFIFSRWPGLGGHRYPIGFSGDTYVTWDSLSFQPYFTATAANVGYGWWSHDIGGHYHGYESKELYVRWVQFGVFSPIMRLHSTKNYYHKREPWRWDVEAESIVTELMRFRHKLIPYLYTMSKNNEAGQLPLITPMYYDYPNEEEAYLHKNQYFFGTELLVAPFITPTLEKLNQSLTNVWLPEGLWFEYFTGDIYQGDHVYPIYGDLNEIPVFAKAGAIIPLAELTTKNQIENPESLEVHVFPGKSNTFTLYEDDGCSLDYQEGKYSETIFDLDYTKDTLKFRIKVNHHEDFIPSNRVYKIHFRSLSKDINIECSHSFDHQYAEETNTHVVMVNHSKDLEITLKSNVNMIKDSFNYKLKIMNLLEKSSYDNDLKYQIGYDCSKYNQDKMGILGNCDTVHDKMLAIINLDMDEYLKNAILEILLRAERNNESN